MIAKYDILSVLRSFSYVERTFVGIDNSLSISKSRKNKSIISDCFNILQSKVLNYLTIALIHDSDPETSPVFLRSRYISFSSRRLYRTSGLE